MRVGVILAARGPAPYLREAVSSVLSQAPAPDELVVVDHASAPPLEPLPGARLVRLSHDGGGPAAARQAGLEALGEVDFVALADADDVWLAGKLAAQARALEAFPEAAVCFGRAAVIDAAGRPTGEELPELAAGLHPAESLRAALYERNAIPAASAVVRRDALLAVGGFVAGAPLPAASDWDLWLRLAGAGYGFVCEPDARIEYRRHAGGLTSDVALLAEAGLEVHSRHASLVDPETASRARASDLATLARGRIRQRRYSDARSALKEAARLRPPEPRERLLALLTAMPGLRALLGRRDPYS